LYSVFGTVTDGGGWKETVEKYCIVMNMRSEDANMNDLQVFKLSRQLY
jgi:hypothetical protein